MSGRVANFTFMVGRYSTTWNSTMCENVVSIFVVYVRWLFFNNDFCYIQYFSPTSLVSGK